MFRFIPAAAVGLALAASVALPADADITGSHVQSANIQAEVGQQLDSRAVRDVFCQMRTAGYNHVTFNPTLIQDTPTSRVITKRKAKRGVEPTATDVQMRRAIRNARACHLGVVIAPHLELKDHSWRAKIKGSDVEFREWAKWMLAYQRIARQEGADTLVIGLEQKGMTRGKAMTPRWLKLIAALRKADPQRKVRLMYAAHTGDELLHLDPKWVRKLDGVGATWYPRLDAEHTEASLLRKFRTDKGEFDAARKRYGKRVTLVETGLRSIDYAHRFAKTREEIAAAHADQQIQAVWYRAMLRTVNGWSSVDGIHLYRTLNSTRAGGSRDKSFTVQGKPAERDVARYFGGSVPRR